MAAASKFTHEARAIILSAIRNGCYRKEACAAAGITPKCLRGWEAEAKEHPDGEFADFLEELELAQHYAQAKLMTLHNALATGTKLPDEVNDVMNAEGAGWRQNSMLKALQFQLERGGTRPWAGVSQVEVTGKDGGPIEHADKASVQIGAALAELAAKVREQQEKDAKAAAGEVPSTAPPGS